MKKLLEILNSKYFLSTVIGLSILVLVVGVLMVKHANEQAVVFAEQQKRLLEQPKPQEEDEFLKRLELIAAQAEAELTASQSTESGPPAKMDFTSDATRKRVADMINKNPAQGTEDWCEIMMVKADADWTKEEQEIFAKNCL
jgi:Protein of unknown function (DUF3012)